MMNHYSRLKAKVPLFIIFALIAVTFSKTTLAQKAWLGDNTSSGNWSAPGNFDGVAFDETSLLFQGSKRLTDNNNDFSLSQSTYKGIQFSSTAGAFNLQGNTVHLGYGDSNGIYNGFINFSATPSSAITQTISLPLIIANTLTVTTQSTGSIYIGGNISSSGSVIKAGYGTLFLYRFNDYFRRYAFCYWLLGRFNPRCCWGFGYIQRRK
jgi:hypothetical protein